MIREASCATLKIVSSSNVHFHHFFLFLLVFGIFSAHLFKPSIISGKHNVRFLVKCNGIFISHLFQSEIALQLVGQTSCGSNLFQPDFVILKRHLMNRGIK